MKVALLPLDAPGRLSIYGQPVAAEVARTLGSPTLQVVVVGAAMAVPQDAALIVEGSISTARKRVTVELRLRTLDSRTALVGIVTAIAIPAFMDYQMKAKAAGQRLQQLEAPDPTQDPTPPQEPAQDPAAPQPAAP